MIKYLYCELTPKLGMQLTTVYIIDSSFDNIFLKLIYKLFVKKKAPKSLLVLFDQLHNTQRHTVYCDIKEVKTRTTTDILSLTPCSSKNYDRGKGGSGVIVIWSDRVVSGRKLMDGSTKHQTL